VRQRESAHRDAELVLVTAFARARARLMREAAKAIATFDNPEVAGLVQPVADRMDAAADALEELAAHLERKAHRS
jgi:hypothetical protein